MAFAKVAKNFLSISLLQAINYLLPLIILPYLVKVVGVANFGISNYILTLFITIKILIDYGYNISGVKSIAEFKHHGKKLDRIFSNIFFTKLYLLFIVCTLLVIAVATIPSLNKHSTFILFSFFVVIGQSIMPVWFYQAMEKSEILVVFSILTRAVYLFQIFTYIKTEDDYIYINFFLGIADIALSVCSLLYIFFVFKIKLSVLSLSQFKAELKQNFVFARGNIYVTLSLTLPFTVLGFFASNIILGYYGIADKIIQVLRTSASILHSATFPRAIQLYNQSFTTFKVFARKLYLLLIFSYSILFLGCLFFPSFIIGFIINSSIVHVETILVLRILSFIPLIAALDLLPTHLLLIQQKQKKYTQILFLSMLFSGCISFIMFYWLHFVGTAIAYLLVELFILFFLAKSNFVELKKIAN
jgi:polysaccharide transporter, PST family